MSLGSHSTYFIVGCMKELSNLGSADHLGSHSCQGGLLLQGHICSSSLSDLVCDIANVIKKLRPLHGLLMKEYPPSILKLGRNSMTALKITIDACHSFLRRLRRLLKGLESALLANHMEYLQSLVHYLCPTKFSLRSCQLVSMEMIQE